MPDPTRRTFLKTSGLAVLGAAVQADAAAVDPTSDGENLHQPTVTELPSASRAKMVNLLQGTDSTSYFSRGNTLPIAALPFGMAHWTLQSRSQTPWMFQPGDRRIQGIRCTHQLSPWLSDYGHAVVLPFCGDVNPEPEARASSYRPEEAHLFPHSLELRLLRYQAQIELIPTERCALLTARFDNQLPYGYLFDIPGKDGEIRPDKAKRTLYFESRANEGGVPANFATYYVVKLPRAWASVEIHDLSGSRVAVVRFEPGADATLEARVATSFISFEQAERNLQLELGDKSTEELSAAAEASWNNCLGRIDVEGGSREQQKIFYSCLYRTLLFPRIWHEPDSSGNPQHFSAFNGKVVPGVMYADHGYWDVYRAWYPLMSILFPERLGEILQAWVNASKEGGWLPQFPCPGYRSCMTGSLIDSVFSDAVVKKIGGFDAETAYQALKKHATSPGNPAQGYGRQGIEYYLRLNYLPADKVEQSVAETADAAYGDFCIGEIARVLGKDEDAAMFRKRSENWRNIFDPTTGFLRGKKEDGTWLAPFDPFQWGSPYVEGSAWQHRWDVPHDIAAMIEALGGKQAAAAALEKMLALPPTFHVGVYGQEIHEMSEMAAVNFGQYAHSNQPVHHLLYIFAAAGRSDLTQYWVRRVMNDLYSLEKFPGDEDTGSMAAWFIMSAIGMYQLCPGKPEYTLGSPLFDRAVLHLRGGRTTVIEADSQSPEAVYVSKVVVNGAARAAATIVHEELARGAQINFHMQSSPSISVGAAK